MLFIHKILSTVTALDLLRPEKVAIAPPVDPDRDVRLSRLLQGESHVLWIRQNRATVLSHLEAEIRRFFGANPILRNTRLYLWVEFADAPGKPFGGYHVRAVEDKQSGETDPTLYGRLEGFGAALEQDEALTRPFILAMELDHFSHVRVDVDERGQITFYQVRFSADPGVNNVFLARRTEDMQDHPPTDSLVCHGSVGLGHIGLHPVSIPFLALPPKIQRYVGTIAFWQEALRRALFWEFGEWRHGESGISRSESFYVWWQRLHAFPTVDLEKLSIFHGTGGVQWLLPAGERGAPLTVGAEAVAMRAGNATQLARRMDYFLSFLRDIRDLPRGWEGLDARLENLGGEGYRAAREEFRKYGVARALRIFRMVRFHPDRLPVGDETALRVFNREVVGLDDPAFLFMNPDALEVRVVHAMIERHLGVPVPFLELEGALQSAGIETLGQMFPQFQHQSAILEVESRRTYRDYFNMATLSLFPHLSGYLTRPMESRFIPQIISDAAIQLGREAGVPYQDELEVETSEGVSYWLYPDGMTRDEALDQKKLFRAEIGNLMGMGYFVIHDGELRKLVSAPLTN